jgi:hypothetical protein
MLAAIAVQDVVKTLGNTKATLAKKKATGIKLGAPSKSIRDIRAGTGLERASHRLHAQYLTQHGR